MPTPRGMRWVAPPNWPQPAAGWSPPAGWTPDPAWGPAPSGWVWWQPRAYPPFWKVRTVADTSPRLKKTMAGTLAIIVLLFVATAAADDTSTPTVDPVAERTQAPLPPSPSASPSPSPSPSASPAPSAAPSLSPEPTVEEVIAAAGDKTALAVLGTLAVKGRAPRTGYDRSLFGQAWADTDRNGCDTRNDMLRRDLVEVTFKAGTRDCVVIAGTLAEPYTGRSIAFTKQDADAVQIDHVVALSDAWQKGAQQWDAGKRLAFANDPLNLLAVDGPTNASKSDGDAATWLPPNTAYRCAMVARQVAVKGKYGVWVTAAERDAIARVLTACPGEVAPVGDAPTTAAVPVPAAPAPVAPPEPAPAASPEQEPPATSGLDPDYGTCKNAIANGAGPYYRGKDPEYDWYRDADSDGIVCER